MSTSSAYSTKDISQRTKRKADSESESDVNKKPKKVKKENNLKKQKKEKKEKKERSEKRKLKELSLRATSTKPLFTFQARRAQEEAKQASLVSEAELNASVPVISPSLKRTMGPLTPEEHAQRQSVIREVYDPVSGRVRLVKGDGEIIERIVTKEQQKDIIKTVQRHAFYL